MVDMILAADSGFVLRKGVVQLLLMLKKKWLLYL
jgi:hypothetical protein